MSDQKPFVTIEAKLLEHCEAGELVRGNFSKNKEENVVDWAIVAQDNKVVVLPGKNSPLYVDKSKDFKQQCLSYGKQFRLLPEYMKPPIMGPTFQSGTLICARSQVDAETSWYLLGAEPVKYLTSPDSPSYGRRYFNISDFGLLTSEPGGLCAAFEDWAIWAWLPTHPNHMTKLYAYPSSEPSAQSDPPKRTTGLPMGS